MLEGKIDLRGAQPQGNAGHLPSVCTWPQPRDETDPGMRAGIPNWRMLREGEGLNISCGGRRHCRRCGGICGGVRSAAIAILESGNRCRQYDAILLARGLLRLGLAYRSRGVAGRSDVSPAVGRGNSAIEDTADGAMAMRLCKVERPATQACVRRNLGFACLGGACQVPVGAYGNALRTACCTCDARCSLRMRPGLSAGRLWSTDSWASWRGPGGEPPCRERRRTSSVYSYGTVYLVGGGPVESGLITLRGQAGAGRCGARPVTLIGVYALLIFPLACGACLCLQKRSAHSFQHEEISGCWWKRAKAGKLCAVKGRRSAIFGAR